MNTFYFIAVCLGAYLVGSIPFGFLIARARGIDIRQVGSGNIGSTNITRAMGFRWGVVVAALDALKAYLPALAARQLAPADWQMLVISLMPVIGHIFSFWMGFKGGKGVAATFGLLAFYFGHISVDYLWNTLLSTVIGSGGKLFSNRVYNILMAVCGSYLLYLGVQFLLTGFTGIKG